jgi:demethylmenaquinone methyltransferase/2-methoxy-6-polyprenyl-1,4-benzoquinol methylase
VFTLYFYRVVPLIGGIIGGSQSAYRYLPASLTNHPDADGLADRFGAAGFREARYIRLAGGAIAVHSGIA